jgi:hypothetical protein
LAYNWIRTLSFNRHLISCIIWTVGFNTPREYYLPGTFHYIMYYPLKHPWYPLDAFNQMLLKLWKCTSSQIILTFLVLFNQKNKHKKEWAPSKKGKGDSLSTPTRQKQCCSLGLTDPVHWQYMWTQATVYIRSTHLSWIQFLCPHNVGAYSVALVRPSIRPSVRPSRRPEILWTQLLLNQMADFA